MQAKTTQDYATISLNQFQGLESEHTSTYKIQGPPICTECSALNNEFFDPLCPGCMNSLTSVDDVFSVIRQWVPQVQLKIDVLITKALEKFDGRPNDRDPITDMTLLMYCCKAGANGVGCTQKAELVTTLLLEKGFDSNIKCKWTDMTALHYASYFNVAPVVRRILERGGEESISSRCALFENGSALHIAAANLSLDAAIVLIEFGADIFIKDDFARTPYDCIPDKKNEGLLQDSDKISNDLQAILNPRRYKTKKDPAEVTGCKIKTLHGLKIGDRVSIDDIYEGTLKFYGVTKFARGLWAGIVLDYEKGKNNGSVNGIVYFKCLPFYGVFVLASRVKKMVEPSKTQQSASRNPVNVNKGKIEISHISSRLAENFKDLNENPVIKIGDRVRVINIVDERDVFGTIRFIGKVDFKTNSEISKWYGIEIDEPLGKHDGTFRGVRYFQAAVNSGLFVTESKLIKLSSSEIPNAREVNYSESKERKVNSQDQQTWQTVTGIQYNKFVKKVPAKLFLKPGMGVIIIRTKEMATIKFIGRVEFADGIWLGLELRNPSIGKHNGIVDGVRYYFCKIGRGIFVRPNKISVHGINGDDLLKPEYEYGY